MTIIASDKKKIIVRSRSVVGTPYEVATVAQQIIDEGRLLDHSLAEHLPDGRVAVRLRVVENVATAKRTGRREGFPWKVAAIFSSSFLGVFVVGLTRAPDVISGWAVFATVFGVALGATVWLVRRRLRRG